MSSVSLKKTQAITELASFICDFLPGTAHPLSKIKIDFGTIAEGLGIGAYWLGGSKRPSLEHLIEQTLTYQIGKFCPLMITIVRESIKYRNKKNQPIMQDDITNLNQIIEDIGFKIPELRDKTFLNSLPKAEPSVNNLKNPTNNESAIDIAQLRKLSDDFLNLSQLDPHPRGFAFEKFLYTLFETYQLNPKPSFKNVGEQIDGSLEFNHEIYLIEAKWQTNAVGYGQLLAFNGKILAHSSIGRGIFITAGSFSSEALEAYSKAQQRAPLIGLNGQDLFFILDEQLAFDLVIKEKIRSLVESGKFYHPVGTFKSKIKSYKL